MAPVELWDFRATISWSAISATAMISAFDSLRNGHFVGKLNNASGQPIAITHLWGLSFGNGGAAGPKEHPVLHGRSDLAHLAPSNNPFHGEFGSLQVAPAGTGRTNDDQGERVRPGEHQIGRDGCFAGELSGEPDGGIGLGSPPIFSAKTRRDQYLADGVFRSVEASYISGRRYPESGDRPLAVSRSSRRASRSWTRRKEARLPR